jgi:hypothetical protein
VNNGLGSQSIWDNWNYPFTTTKNISTVKEGKYETQNFRCTNIMYKLTLASYLTMAALTKHSANDTSFLGGNTIMIKLSGLLLWSEFLATDLELRVRFPAPPDILRNSGSGTRSTQPRLVKVRGHLKE